MTGKIDINAWLLMGTQKPDFEIRLAIHEELRARREDIDRLTLTTDEQHLALKELAQDNDRYKARVDELEAAICAADKAIEIGEGVSLAYYLRKLGVDEHIRVVEALEGEGNE